jgi:alkanesulfonate monooxygenase SsuD/methylene tetrahydromethanopterin reductase-like flavin-dependent oxidoreductase (luciferase family)
VKRGLYLAPFDELADPRLLADLAGVAEPRGWQGLFLWDRIVYPPESRPVSEPWVALSAIASARETIRLGPMITPLSRKRVGKVARETLALDHPSRGRLTLRVGLGNVQDLEPFGEVLDPRQRARLLEDALDRLDQLWVVVEVPREMTFVLGRPPERHGCSPVSSLNRTSWASVS